MVLHGSLCGRVGRRRILQTGVSASALTPRFVLVNRVPIYVHYDGYVPDCAKLSDRDRSES